MDRLTQKLKCQSVNYDHSQTDHLGEVLQAKSSELSEWLNMPFMIKSTNALNDAIHNSLPRGLLQDCLCQGIIMLKPSRH